MVAGWQEPVILEKLISLSLADLRALQLFNKSEGYKSVPLSIRRADSLQIDSYGMQLAVSTQAGNSYVEFSYLIDQHPITNRVPLVQHENLLTGQFKYYFLCSAADKICRKLYFHKDRWVCRDAIPNRFYQQHIISKRNRPQYEAMKRLQSLERDIALCGKKWFKTYNKNGEHTTKMKKVIRARNELTTLV